jgi:hypothetical protein
MFRLLGVILQQARVHSWGAIGSRFSRRTDCPPERPADKEIAYSCSPLLVTADYLKLLLSNYQTLPTV